MRRDDAERRRALLHGLEEPLGRALRIVHGAPGERAEHDRADREDVGAPVDLIALALRLLGRHVRGGAEHDARGGGRARELGVAQTREAEVEDLHEPGLRDEEVARLDVAMDDVARVERAASTSST